MLDLILAAAFAMQAADACYAGDPVAAPAGCPRWRLLEPVRDPTGARGYLDPASAVRAGNHVDLDTLTVLPLPIGGEVYRFVARVRLDCAALTTRIVHIIGYDDDGARLRSAPQAGVTPRPAPAGTLRAALIDEFCRRNGQ